MFNKSITIQCNMKEKILYVVLAIVFIVAIVITAVLGLRVDMEYAEANTITFTVGKNIKIEEIKEIAEQVFQSKNVLVQQVEFFGDSAIIKVREDVTDDKISNLCTRINQKYDVQLTTDNFAIAHIPNTRLRDVIEPYIVPIGLSTLLIVGYYAIRYKGTRKMIGLIKYLIISEGILYSLYAIGRIQINELTMPLALATYTLVIIIYSFICEIDLDGKKSKDETNKPE